MDQALLQLHSYLRWVVLLLLVICLFMAIAKNQSVRSASLWLMISAHTMLLIGLYQLINGANGFLKVTLPPGEKLMKNTFYRFFWVEHPLMMIIAIILITMARRKAKVLNYKAVSWLLFIALVLILAAIPWPFREGVARPWIR
jgi:hypothetical protein